MAWIADAHRDWHTVYPDRPWDCPLDCYDPPMEEEDFEEQDVFFPEVVEGPPQFVF